MSFSEPIPPQMTRISELLQESQIPDSVSVRELLSWFGAQRRGFYVTQSINEAMSQLHLTATPDFESAYIDAHVRFELAKRREEQVVDVAEGEVSSLEGVPDSNEEAQYVTGAISNPTYQVSRLEAANHEPISINPEASLEEAVMLMTMHDYSQLPVMSSPFSLKGVVSWLSIGRALSLKQPVVQVKDCMETAFEVRHDESLFSAINRIVQHGYVLVRDDTNRVAGIVTASDLSVQLRQLSEPFLLIGEIENYIRRIIDGKFTSEDLSIVKDPSDTARIIERVSDLTFGEYVRLLENDVRWEKLLMPIPRSAFVKQLNEVRVIRNDVMHFDPDGLPPMQLDKLRNFVRLLQTLQQVGAIK